MNSVSNMTLDLSNTSFIEIVDLGQGTIAYV